MKYLVHVKVINEFTIEVSAKDEEIAEDKACAAWYKVSEGAIKIDHSRIGKFEHVDEEIEIETEEI